MSVRLRGLHGAKDAYVDAESVPALVGTGMYAPPETIRWTDANGTETTTSYDEFLRSRSFGRVASVTPQADVEREAGTEHERGEYGGGIVNNAEALLGGAVDEATFGLAKPFEKEREYNPTAAIVGRVIGGVGPVLVPGLGEATAAKDAAEAGRIALGAADLLPGRLLARGGGAVAEAIGGTKGVIAAGALEGGGYHVLRAALDDDVDLSAEGFLGSMALGGAVAGAGTAVSKLVTGGERAWARMGRRASEAAEAVDNPRLVAAIERDRPLPASLRGTTDAEHGADILGNISTDLPLHSANQAVVRDARAFARQVDGWRSSPLGTVAPEIEPVVARGRAALDAVTKFAGQPPEVQAQVMGAYNGHLNDIDAMAAEIAGRPGGLDVSRLPRRWAPQNVALRHEALAKIDPSGLGNAELAARQLAVRLTAGTERVGAQQALESGLLTKVAGLVKHVPVVGRPAAAVLGMAKGAGGFSSGLIVDRLIEGGLGGHALAGLAAKALPVAVAAKAVQRAFREPSAAAALSGLSAEHVSRLLGSDSGLPRERGPRALAVAEALQQRSPDEARRLAAEGAQHVGRVSPDVLASIGEAAARRQAAVQAALGSVVPPRSAARPLRAPVLSASQTSAVDRIALVAADPTAFARLLIAGKLDRRTLALAERLWPAHVRRARAAAMSWLSSHRGDVARGPGRILQDLLGPDAVGASSQRSALAAQRSIAMGRQRMARPPGQPRTPPAGGSRADLLPPAMAASGRPSDR